MRGSRLLSHWPEAGTKKHVCPQLSPVCSPPNGSVCNWHLGDDDMTSRDTGLAPGALASAGNSQRTERAPEAPSPNSTSMCHSGPEIRTPCLYPGSSPKESTQHLGRGTACGKAGLDLKGFCLPLRLAQRDTTRPPTPPPPTAWLRPSTSGKLGDFETLVLATSKEG